MLKLTTSNFSYPTDDQVDIFDERLGMKCSIENNSTKFMVLLFEGWIGHYRNYTPSDNAIDYAKSNASFHKCSRDIKKLNKLGVRGFSTNCSYGFYESKSLNKRLAQKTKNKSLKLDSPIYNNLNILIKNNPINEETQIKIEKFLFDYSYVSLGQANTNLDFCIDYSIINPKLT